MKKFLQSWLINTLAVLTAVYVVPGIRFGDRSFWTPFVTSLVLGILNTFIRPVLMCLALPLVILTLGLFMLMINALVLYLVSLLIGPYFQVDGFWSAVFGALVISVVSTVLNFLTGVNRARMQIRRGPPRHDPGPGGDGPIIDV